ncbi:MAG: hypothetical protein CBC13_02350 [Planctomycetia bacterium TMED53]|nr:MAG: hypothetical protein CBC13_02350 [Planctomycetia bacterium TMED53]
MRFILPFVILLLWDCSLLHGQAIWFGGDSALNALNQNQVMTISELDERVELLCRTADGGAWVHLENETVVRRYGPAGDLVSEISTGLGLAGMAVDAQGHLWASRPGTDDVLRIHGSTGEVSAFPVAGVPYGIAIGTDGKVWVSCSYSNEVVILDSAGSIVSSTPVGFFPTGISATLDGGVWLAEKQGLRRLDSSGETVWTGMAGIFPIGVTTDPQGRGWFSCQTSHQVVVVSEAGIEIVIDVPERPLGISAHSDGSVSVLSRLGGAIHRIGADGVLISEQAFGFPTGRGDMTGVQLSQIVDPLGDFDGDGVMNGAEVAQGTNPFLGPQNTFVRGDVDRNGQVQLADAIQALSVLYIGEETSCMEALDVNDDQQLDLSDPVRILGYLFLNSIPPASPFPSAGADPAPLPGFYCSN